eukprot:3794313-Alexandrium_andersonii.AAC.1
MLTAKHYECEELEASLDVVRAELDVLKEQRVAAELLKAEALDKLAQANGVKVEAVEHEASTTAEPAVKSVVVFTEAQLKKVRDMIHTGFADKIPDYEDKYKVYKEGLPE